MARKTVEQSPWTEAEHLLMRCLSALQHYGHDDMRCVEEAQELFARRRLENTGEQPPTRLPRDRPSFEVIYMSMAHELAQRSTCSRLQVGTVITTVDLRKVLAVGYNGNASGLPNMCDREEPGNCGCLHSEENAVINCDSPRHIEKVVFVTHLPCVMCAKRLINLGNVRTVYYAKKYRSTESMALFEKAGIQVIDGYY